MNRIYIRDMIVNCIIGTEPKERIEKQDVCINIRLECDFGEACESDNLNHTVDYKSLKDELAGLIENSSFLLIEKMAGKIAEVCLMHDRVQGVRVCVDKPGALTGTRSVAVEIERKR